MKFIPPPPQSANTNLILSGLQIKVECSLQPSWLICTPEKLGVSTSGHSVFTCTHVFWAWRSDEPTLFTKLPAVIVILLSFPCLCRTGVRIFIEIAFYVDSFFVDGLPSFWGMYGPFRGYLSCQIANPSGGHQLHCPLNVCYVKYIAKCFKIQSFDRLCNDPALPSLFLDWCQLNLREVRHSIINGLP